MRTGSSTTAVARSSGKQLSWNVYCRKTSVLSTSLASGAWTDVSGYLVFEQLDKVKQKIEYGVGQFTIDSYKLPCKNVAWWKANLLNVASNEFVEVKVVSTLGGVLYNMFCGFVDVNRDGYTPNEIDDSIQLIARSAEDIGSRTPAELISTQYIDAVNGLVLFGIAGMYVTNANVASYVLQVGTHIITYDYNGGTRRAKLDSGAYVTLVAGSNTLGDVDNTTNDLHRVVINVPVLADLPDTGVLVDEIVVMVAGTTFPNCWYRNQSVSSLLKLAYAQIGITSLVFDTMNTNSYDGAKRYVEMDAPPADGTFNDIYAVVNIGSLIYLGIGNKLYKRDMALDTYTLVRTLTAGHTITGLWYNSRNGHLWIGLTSTTNYDLANFVYRYTIATDKLSAELSLPANVNARSVVLLDYNYTGVSYKYSLFYTTLGGGTGSAREVLGSAPEVEGQALTDSLVFSAATMAATVRSDFSFLYVPGVIRILINDSASPFLTMYNQLSINSGGTWVNDGHQLTGGIDNFTFAVYNSSEARIYYGFGSLLKSHPATSNTLTTVFTTTLSSPQHSLFTGGDNKTYWYVAATAPKTALPLLFSVAANVATSISNYAVHYATRAAMTYYSSSVYGGLSGYANSQGKFFQIGATFIFHVPFASFKDISIKDVLNKLSRGFNLLNIISSDKAGRIYRRGDASGVPQTSGNSIALTMSDVSEIEEVVNAFPPFELVRVIGASLTTTYNGTSFDAAVLSTKDTAEINSPFIPNTIVKDIAYYCYQFFKTKRTLYRVKLSSTPLFQYEPFDGCSVTFTGKIVKTGSGIIYSATYSPNGDTELEVLI